MLTPCLNTRVGATVSPRMFSLRRLVALSLWLPLSSFAQNVYSWEDEEGAHFTDDPTTVPKKIKAAKEPLLPVVSKKLPMPSPAALEPRTIQPRSETLDEQEWRAAFVAAHRTVANLKRSIAALEAAVPPRTECLGQFTTRPNGSVRGNSVCQLNPAHDSIRVQIVQQQVELQAAEADLQLLDRQASQASVPREWRRGW